jgi:hypothetical protein
MGKKVRCRTKRTSKGQRRSISRSSVRLVRDARTEGDKFMSKLQAWRDGHDGFVTIKNPNTSETDKPFIRVSFRNHFGGLFKDVKHRVRPSEDKDRVEI